MNVHRAFASVAVIAAIAAPSSAAMFSFTDGAYPGLAAEAEFTLLGPTTLEIRLRNTSTGVPGGFEAADQILTSISFDLGAVSITGGSAHIGATSQTINFSTGSYGPGHDISGEWGYGNAGATGLLSNFVSTNVAGATAFGGPNLDGPGGLNGPQGGIVANPLPASLGGLGAVQDEVIFTLTLSAILADLSFLDSALPIVEFGSDAAFITAPAPGSLAVLGLAALPLTRRRRAKN